MNDMSRIRLYEGDTAGPTLMCLPGAMYAPEVFAEAARRSGLPVIGRDAVVAKRVRQRAPCGPA